MFSWTTRLSILRALLTKRSPYYIQFYINGRCNLKCKQCNIVETNSGIGEMSLDEISIVADNIRRIGGGIVLLTGGEPFLRKDIDQIAKRFIDRGLDVRLQTAGIARDEQLRKCYDVGARDLNISLDSLDATKQDYINSVPGSWAKAIDAIERVSHVFSPASAICSLGCVLSRFNYLEIPAILEFATSIGWYLSLVPVHIAAKPDSFGFRSYEQSFKFDQESLPELHKTIERLIQMKRQGYLLFDAESYLWSSFEFLQGKPPTWRRYNKGMCDSPNLYFAVRPNGDFTTCCDYVLKDPLSLKDPNFAQRYLSGEAHAQALPIVKSCSGCHYGSYPEVSLSVRDYRALWERIRIVLFRKRRRFIKTYDRGGLFQLVEQIRAKYSDVYLSDAWLTEEARSTLARWNNPDEQRQLVEEDNRRRVSEGRIRRRNIAAHGDSSWEGRT